MPIEIVIDRTPKVGNGMMVPSTRPDAELKTYERIAKTVKPLDNIKMFRVEYITVKPSAQSEMVSKPESTPGVATDGKALGYKKDYYEDIVMSSADKFSKGHLLKGKQKKRRIVDPSEFISILNSNIDIEDFTADDTHSISSSADHLRNNQRVMNDMIRKSKQLKHRSTIKHIEPRINEEAADNKRLRELQISQERVAKALAAPRKVLQEVQSYQNDDEIHKYSIELASTNADRLEAQLLHLEKEIHLVQEKMDGDLDEAISGGSSVAGSSVSGSRLSNRTEFFDTNKKLGIQNKKKPGMQFKPPSKSNSSTTDAPLTAGSILERGLVAMKAQFDKDMIADQKRYMGNVNAIALAAAKLNGVNILESNWSGLSGAVGARGRQQVNPSKLVPGKPAGVKPTVEIRRNQKHGAAKTATVEVLSNDDMSTSSMSVSTVSNYSVNQGLYRRDVGQEIFQHHGADALSAIPMSHSNEINNGQKLELENPELSREDFEKVDEQVEDEGVGSVVEDVNSSSPSEKSQMNDEQSVNSAIPLCVSIPLQPVPPMTPPPSNKANLKLSISTPISHQKHRVTATQNTPAPAKSIIHLAEKFMKRIEVTGDAAADDDADAFSNSLVSSFLPSHNNIIKTDPDKQIKTLQQATTNRNRKLEMLLEPILLQEQREARAMEFLGKPYNKDAVIETLQFHSSDMKIRNTVPAQASFATAPPAIALKDKDIAMMAKHQLEREQMFKTNQPLPPAMIAKAVGDIKNPAIFGINENYVSLRNVAFAQEARQIIERQQREWTTATDKACRQGVKATTKLINTWENLLDLQEHYQKLSLQELKEKRFVLPQTIEFGYSEQSKIEHHEESKAFRSVKPSTSPKLSSNERTFLTDITRQSHARDNYDDDQNSPGGVSEGSDGEDSLCKQLGHVHSVNLAVKIKRKELFRQTKELKSILVIEWFVKLLRRLKKTREASSVAQIPPSLLRFVSALKGIIVFNSTLSKEIMMNLMFNLIDVGDHQIRLVYKMINTICEGLNISSESLLEEYTKRKIEPHRSLRLQVMKNAKLLKRKRQKSKVAAKRNMAKKKPSEKFVNLHTLVEEEEGDDDVSRLSGPDINVLTSDNLRLLATGPLSSRFDRKLSFSNFSDDGDDMMSQLDDVSDSVSEMSALDDFDEIKFLR